MFTYHPTDSPANNKHHTLLGQFVSYEENKVLWKGEDERRERKKDKKFISKNLISLSLDLFFVGAECESMIDPSDR